MCLMMNLMFLNSVFPANPKFSENRGESDKPWLIKLSCFGQAAYVGYLNGYLRVDTYFISVAKFRS